MAASKSTPRVESLEVRAMLSAEWKPEPGMGEGYRSLILTGSEGDDVIRVVGLGMSPSGEGGPPGRSVQVYGVEGVEDGTIFHNLRRLSIRGGAGDDTIRVEGSVHFNAGGGAGDDHITNATDDGASLHGEEGDDTLVGGAHSDSFSTEPGNDTYYGGEGAHDGPSARFSDPDYEGDGMWHYGHPHPGSQSAKQGAIFRLDQNTIPRDGYGGYDRIFGIEGVMTASDFDDLIFGDGDANNILADGGNDSVFAGGGDDRVIANTGSAYILGGDGDDWIHSSFWNISFIDGGRGDDTIQSTGFRELDLGDTIVADKDDDLQIITRKLDPDEPREAAMLAKLEKAGRQMRRDERIDRRRLTVPVHGARHEAVFDTLIARAKLKRLRVGSRFLPRG